MSIHLRPDQETQLRHLAKTTGRDADQLAQEAVDRLFEYEDWFARQVEEGLAQIERGQLVSHEEVGQRLEQRLREKGLA